MSIIDRASLADENNCAGSLDVCRRRLMPADLKLLVDSVLPFCTGQPMPGRKFSLGAALVDGVPADDCAAAGEHVPETWLALFATKHASPDVLLGLFSSSKAGRDVVLATAPTVTLTLTTTTQYTYDEWMARLGAVREALTTRAGRDTTLVLAGNHRAYSTAITALIPSELASAGSGSWVRMPATGVAASPCSSTARPRPSRTSRA